MIIRMIQIVATKNFAKTPNNTNIFNLVPHFTMKFWHMTTWIVAKGILLGIVLWGCVQIKNMHNLSTSQ